MFTINEVVRLLVFSAICVSAAQTVQISFNDMLPPRSTTEMDSTQGDVDITLTCVITSYGALASLLGSYFSINIYRCRYTDDISCSTASDSKKGSCLLFRAFHVGSTEVRYCGCRDLNCRRLQPNNSVQFGVYSISLPAATCQDAGRYICQAEELDTHVSEASRSLEMLPGNVDLYARLENLTADGVVVTGSVLDLYCRVFSTLPVTFIWNFQDPDFSRWAPVTHDFAYVENSMPPLQNRCDTPWTSTLKRTLDVKDDKRQYRCGMSYMSQGTDYMFWSAAYSLGREIHATPAVPATHRISDQHEAEVDMTSSREFMLAGGDLSPDAQVTMKLDPRSADAVYAVLMCLAVLAVSGLLCLTVLLITESNLRHLYPRFFRNRRHSMFFPRLARSRRPPSRRQFLPSWGDGISPRARRVRSLSREPYGDLTEALFGTIELLSPDRANRSHETALDDLWLSREPVITQDMGIWNVGDMEVSTPADPNAANTSITVQSSPSTTCTSGSTTNTTMVLGKTEVCNVTHLSEQTKRATTLPLSPRLRTDGIQITSDTAAATGVSVRSSASSPSGENSRDATDTAAAASQNTSSTTEMPSKATSHMVTEKTSVFPAATVNTDPQNTTVITTTTLNAVQQNASVSATTIARKDTVPGSNSVSCVTTHSMAVPPDAPGDSQSSCPKVGKSTNNSFGLPGWEEVVVVTTPPRPQILQEGDTGLKGQ